MTITPIARQLNILTPPALTAGFPLINGTPTFLTWNVPNDGNVHRFVVLGLVDVTVLEVGGAIAVIWTAPDGTASGTGINLLGGALAVGLHQNSVVGFAQPGTTVTVKQQTNLTGGTAVLWAEIYGS